LVAYAYRNTVNDATGYTPQFLMTGREMCSPDVDFLKELPLEQYHQKVSDMALVMRHLWEHVGSRVIKNVDKLNKVPVERLEFKPYKVGDFFYSRMVPRRFWKNKWEKHRHSLCVKLQFRYTGPYIITQVHSDVLYSALIHGRERRVHAINMKPV
jgi:hypothetical protein